MKKRAQIVVGSVISWEETIPSGAAFRICARLSAIRKTTLVLTVLDVSAREDMKARQLIGSQVIRYLSDVINKSTRLHSNAAAAVLAPTDQKNSQRGQLAAHFSSAKKPKPNSKGNNHGFTQ